jgi:hypothetical protein
MNKPVINCQDGWSRLEEVLLGDVYPKEWYNDLPNEVSDVFQHLTEITQEDLTVIENKLQDFGVVVKRPQYKDINDYVNFKGNLEKPMITPRDHFLTLGNNFYCENDFPITKSVQHIINEYKECPNSNVKPTIQLNDGNTLAGSHTVRAGKDFYIDFQFYNNGKQELVDRYTNLLSDEFKDYRQHLLFGGGHIDSTFTILKPGLIITSEYFEDTEKTFPKWECIHLNNPEFKQFKAPPMSANGKFYDTSVDFRLPDIDSPIFNQYVIDHALEWVGNYTETYFDLNCLVIDESNVMMLGENEDLYKKLDSYGITVHQMPFRTRTFWDGGLHCLTSDIRRQRNEADYFPNRGTTSSITVY